MLCWLQYSGVLLFILPPYIVPHNTNKGNQPVFQTRVHADELAALFAYQTSTINRWRLTVRELNPKTPLSTLWLELQVYGSNLVRRCPSTPAAVESTR